VLNKVLAKPWRDAVKRGHTMKKLTVILSILSTILLSQLSAANDLNIVAQDTFYGTGTCPNSACTSWISGNAAEINVRNTAASYSLSIQRNENAIKTFFFPLLEEKQSVTVKFVFGKSSTVAAANAYTLTTKLNNETHNLSFSTLSGSIDISATSNTSAKYFKEITYNATLDTDKKLKIDFSVIGSSGDHYGYINSVTIIADGVAWIDDNEIEQNTASDVNMTFIVHNPSGIAAEIDYKTVPLNAQEGIDYEAVDDTLTFNSGEKEKSISVKIPKHSIPLTEDRRFAVSIESADVRITDAEAIGTIKAIKGAISIEDAGFIYAGTSGVNATANFTLTNSYSTAVNVTYETVDISAQAGINYVYKSGTITLAANQNTTITVTVIGNDTLTTQKEFKVVLSGAHLTKDSAVAVLYGYNNTQISSGTNSCSNIEVVNFLNNAASNVSGVIRGSMNTTGPAKSDGTTSQIKGHYYEFTAGMDARVEITIRALGRTLDFIQSTSSTVQPCTGNTPNTSDRPDIGNFFWFYDDDLDSALYYVLKADQKFSLPTGGIPANTLLSWWMNPEGAIAVGQLDPRTVEHSVMHVKEGEKGYFYVGAYNPTTNSSSSKVTTDYEIEIKYLPEVTNITKLANNGISNYSIVNPVETQNLYGNIKLIGNSFLCVTDYGDDTGGFNNVYIDTSKGGLFRKASGEACTNNYKKTANGQQMPYLDMDSDASTYNSVMAKLSTPAGSKVVWAGLFWTGMVDRNSPQWFKRHQGPYRSYNDRNYYVANSFDVEKILFKVPGSNSYQEVYAEKLMHVNGYGAAMFGAYKDITDLINKEAADGEYWAANFRGSAGFNEYGNYGGWSMVVIYEEDPENPDIEGVFRNLSVFNGFGRVSSDNAISLGGFLTPRNGDVDAFLHIFAGEGETGSSKDGDYIRLYPTKVGGNSTSNAASKVKDSSKYPANFIATHPSTLTADEKVSLIGTALSHDGVTTNNNILTGAIGKADRYPITLNGNGIDLKSIDIGEHMYNTQSELKIYLNAGDDWFYPSMVATSIQLYDPNICYEENITFRGRPIEAGNTPSKNSEVEYTLTVRHKEYEKAQNVVIRKSFIEEYGLNYVGNSIYVKNSFDVPPASEHKTDAIGDDVAQYSDDTIRVNIGRDATIDHGGWLQTDGSVSDMVEIKYKATLNTNESIKENVYIIDYSNTELKLDFKNRPIKKCYDFTNTIDPLQPSGNYRVVNEKSAAADIENPSSADNALYTQIADKSFNVRLIVIDKDDQTKLGAPEEGTSVRLELIKYPDPADNDEDKRKNCENATLHEEYAATYELSGSITDIENIKVSNAYQDATFRVRDSVTNSTSCSADRFAIRPAHFKVNVPDRLIGGRENKANLTAVTADNTTVTTKYDQAANAILLGNTTLKIPLVGCAISEEIADGAFVLTNKAFVNGIAEITARYNNVGDVKTGFIDNIWTNDDSKLNGVARDDCIHNSTSNDHDADAKVGCDIATADEIITFIPKDFRADVTVRGAGGGNFVYLSNNPNMAGEVVTALTARLDDDTAATNYHQGCFANDVEYEITLNNNPITGWDVGDRPDFGGDTTPQQRIRFFDRLGNAILTSNNVAKNGVGGFTVEENQFVDGEVVNDVRFDFNFQRSVTEAEEPFIIDAAVNFLIQNDDIQDADGVNAVVNIANTQTRFFYGRAFVKDYEGPDPIINGEVWYEVFCDACVKGATYNINWPDMSEKSSRWFFNRWHIDNSVGKVDNYTPNIGNGVTSGIRTEVTGAFNAGGAESITFRNLTGQTPYEDTIHAKPDEWMIHNPNNAAAKDISPNVKFFGIPGGWAGRGEVNEEGDTTGGVIETEPERKTKMKADW
jgi:hypothetical protein